MPSDLCSPPNQGGKPRGSRLNARSEVDGAGWEMNCRLRDTRGTGGGWNYSTDHLKSAPRVGTHRYLFCWSERRKDWDIYSLCWTNGWIHTNLIMSIQIGDSFYVTSLWNDKTNCVQVTWGECKFYLTSNFIKVTSWGIRRQNVWFVYILSSI